MARILVVDDDPDILRLADQILAAAGHTVLVAEDALRALDWLNQIHFDLLLSDANMPLYSGFDLVNTIRKNSKFNDMAIAMLTGLRERADVERAVKAGVDDYIVKPLDPLLLVQKVNSLFARKSPTNYPEIHLANIDQVKGDVRRSVTVESLSELGLRILTDIPLKPGEMLDIKAEIFKTLDLEVPPMRVLRVDKDPESGLNRAQLIFLGAREPMLQKIRRWIFSHGATNGKAA
jgi:DNA-binding response OmpR family regulator